MSVFWVLAATSFLWMCHRCLILTMRPAAWVPPGWWFVPGVICGAALILGALT